MLAEELGLGVLGYVYAGVADDPPVRGGAEGEDPPVLVLFLAVLVPLDANVADDENPVPPVSHRVEVEIFDNVSEIHEVLEAA